MAISFVFLPHTPDDSASHDSGSVAANTPGKNSFQNVLAESRNRLKSTLLPPHAVRSMFKYTQGNVVRLEDMKQELDETMLSFRYYVNQIFEALEFCSPVEIKSDAYGRLFVSNSHPDKARIERIFSENSDLRNMAIQIMALADLVESSKEATAFQDAYRVNPQAAMARYFYLFDEKTNVNRFYIILRAQDSIWTVHACPERLYKFRFNAHACGDLFQPSINDFWVKWNLDR